MSKKPTYKELLRRPQWLRKRAKIIELYKRTCQHCRKVTDFLTIHHRYYVSGRMPWQYPDWALIPVCDQACHWILHEKAKDTFAEWETNEGPQPIPEIIIPEPQPETPPPEPVSEEKATAKFAAIFDMLGKLP